MASDPSLKVAPLPASYEKYPDTMTIKPGGSAMTDPRRAAEALLLKLRIILDRDCSLSAHGWIGAEATDAILEYRAQCAAEARAEGWQPIATAPKDPTRQIVVLWFYSREIGVLKWENETGFEWHGANFWLNTPPLPAAPPEREG